MKKKYITSILVIGMIAQIVFLSPMLIPPKDASAQVIRVMTYNIHQYYVLDPSDIEDKTGRYVFDELLKVIKESGADIIGLQENEGLRLSSGNQNGVAWLASQLGMYYYYGPATSEQIYGEAILSRWPIIQQEWKQYPRPEGIERGVMYVVIDSPIGQLNVFNTHFEIDRFKTAQREEANFLIDYVGDRKAIILGDFNTRSDENNEAYHLLYNRFTYGLVESGLHPNATEGFTSPAHAPTHKIDYIWLTRGDWNVLPDSYAIYGNPDASDHLAVLIELSS